MPSDNPRGIGRLVALSAVLTLVPLIALTVFALYVSTSAVRKEVNDKLLAATNSSSDFVAADTLGVAGIVDAYSRRLVLVNTMADGKVSSDEATRSAPALNDLIGSRPGLARAFLADTNGNMLLSVPGAATGNTDLSQSDWFQGVTKSGQPYVSSLVKDDGQPLMSYVVAPIRSSAESTRVEGYLVSGYTLNGVQDHARDVSSTEGLQIMVTDQKGAIAAQSGSILTNIVDDSDDERVGPALTGDSGTRTVSRDDTEYLSAFAPVPGTGWTVVASNPSNEAFAGVNDARKAILICAMFLGVVLVIGLVLLTKLLRRRAEAEAALAVARDKAMDASRAKSEFLANMSHEVRTPLNGILGLTSLLMTTDLARPQREYTEMVHASGESLLAIINDILDFSKIEAGRIELESTVFDPIEIVSNAVVLFEGQASSKDVKIDAVIDDAVPHALVGDGNRLRQVILNLVGNAVKFTDSGRVEVACKVLGRTQSKREGVSDLLVAFEVTDTGIGIAESQRGRVFESFSQADASTTRKYGGTGLGLAISKRLVEMMGGQLDYESTEGKGTRFFAHIPFETTVLETREQRLTVPDELGPSDRPVVLVAEDNVVNQRVALGMLARLGCEVDCVSDGRQAIEAAERRDYDVIFMDVQMPDVDGYEATRRIRMAEGDTRHTVIIALTAGAMKGDRERCIEAGMDEFVPKPVDWGLIAERLRTAKSTSVSVASAVRPDH